MQVLVVGYGEVGNAFAALARPLGAVITPVATKARTEDGVAVHAVAQLPELLPKADLVVMAAAGRSDRRPVLDAAGLALLRPSTYLVNVGRGSLIAEDVLSQRLAAGQLAGAALDVTAVEPLPASSPLWETPNLILTSHVAGLGDPSALARLALLCTTNAVNLLEGKALVGAV